jgi:hypothetical protein
MLIPLTDPKFGLFKWSMFTYVNTQNITPLEIHVIYLGNKENYCIFKTGCIISVLFSVKYHLFHNFIFLCSNHTLFIKHELKFKYHPSHSKGKTPPLGI